MTFKELRSTITEAITRVWRAKETPDHTDAPQAKVGPEKAPKTLPSVEQPTPVKPKPGESLSSIVGRRLSSMKERGIVKDSPLAVQKMEKKNQVASVTKPAKGTGDIKVTDPAGEEHNLRAHTFKSGPSHEDIKKNWFGAPEPEHKQGLAALNQNAITAEKPYTKNGRKISPLLKQFHGRIGVNKSGAFGRTPSLHPGSDAKTVIKLDHTNIKGHEGFNHYDPETGVSWNHVKNPNDPEDKGHITHARFGSTEVTKYNAHHFGIDPARFEPQKPKESKTDEFGRTKSQQVYQDTPGPKFPVKTSGGEGWHGRVPGHRSDKHTFNVKAGRSDKDDPSKSAHLDSIRRQRFLKNTEQPKIEEKPKAASTPAPATTETPKKKQFITKPKMPTATAPNKPKTLRDLAIDKIVKGE